MSPPDGGGGGAPAPGPLAKAAVNTPCNSVACELVNLPLETSPAIRELIFDCRSPGDELVLLEELELLALPLCSAELISVRAEDNALWSDELMVPEETSDSS